MAFPGRRAGLDPDLFAVPGVVALGDAVRYLVDRGNLGFAWGAKRGTGGRDRRYEKKLVTAKVRSTYSQYLRARRYANIGNVSLSSSLTWNFWPLSKEPEVATQSWARSLPSHLSSVSVVRSTLDKQALPSRSSSTLIR